MTINRTLNLISRLFVPVVLFMGVIFYYLGTKGSFFGEKVGATYYLVHPISLVILVLSAYLAIIEVIKWRNDAINEKNKVQKNEKDKVQKNEKDKVQTTGELFKTIKTILVFIGCVFIYMMLLKYTNFIISTMIYLILSFFAFKLRKIIPLFLFPIGLTLLAYFIFKTLFNVPLP